jgi:hypothetical protein
MLFNLTFFYPQYNPTYPLSFPHLFFVFQPKFYQNSIITIRQKNQILPYLKPLFLFPLQKKPNFNEKIDIFFKYPTYQPPLITKATNLYLYNL